MKRNKKRLRPPFYILVALILITVFLGVNDKIEKEIEIKQENEIAKIEDNILIDISNTSISITVVGDIMCHNTQYNDAYNKETNSYDFSYVFEEVKKYIEKGDISIGNLETTLAGKEIGYSSYPTFNTPEAMAQDLKELGIDVLSTVNNHSLDKGYKGIVNTIEELNKVGINHTGTYKSYEDSEKILILDVKGIKIAFLAYTYGTNGIPIPSQNEYCINMIREEKIIADLGKAKELHPDLIVVNMHWGVEYSQYPSSEQERLTEILFKNGADLILGSHPHVLQKMEKREIELEDGSKKDGFIIYSLGNFISGQVKNYTRQSVILDIAITKNGKNRKNIYRFSWIYTSIYE
ncbi:MAG: CapA family protein [Candidatus Scatovivens sp.]